MLTKRILRSLAAGGTLTVVAMYLYIAGELPGSLQSVFTPTLFIASKLRIGAHDAGIIYLIFLEGILVFGVLALLLDILFIHKKPVDHGEAGGAPER